MRSDMHIKTCDQDVHRAAVGWHVCLIYISYGICARMRMLHGPITARAPALLLQFQTRVLAPKKLKSDARARVPWIWNRHHVRRHHAGGPAPTGVMLITTGITGMSGRPWEAALLHDEHFLSGWSFYVLYLPRLSGRARRSGFGAGLAARYRLPGAGLSC